MSDDPHSENIILSKGNGRFCNKIKSFTLPEIVSFMIIENYHPSKDSNK